MLFVVTCKDKPGALDIRMANRPDHLAFLDGLDQQLKAAGPFLDKNGAPDGSMLIIQARDQSEIEQIAANDPYAKAGLFETVEIKPWNWILKNPENE